jgi:hypothetical protein
MGSLQQYSIRPRKARSSKSSPSVQRKSTRREPSGLPRVGDALRDIERSRKMRTAAERLRAKPASSDNVVPLAEDGTHARRLNRRSQRRALNEIHTRLFNVRALIVTAGLALEGQNAELDVDVATTLRHFAATELHHLVVNVGLLKLGLDPEPVDESGGAS